MLFSREALKGIYESLPECDRIFIEKMANQRNVKYNRQGKVCDDDLHLVQDIMIHLGYIIPFQKDVTDDGAEEYNYIMEIQDMM